LQLAQGAEFVTDASALLGMEQRELAKLADISVSTLIRLEGAGWSGIPGSMKTVNRVLEVLERRGVKFTELGGNKSYSTRRIIGAPA
jgi:transcriptional regulator with XRE-family HTH domain